MFQRKKEKYINIDGVGFYFKEDKEEEHQLFKKLASELGLTIEEVRYLWKFQFENTLKRLKQNKDSDEIEFPRLFVQKLPYRKLLSRIMSMFFYLDKLSSTDEEKFKRVLSKNYERIKFFHRNFMYAFKERCKKLKNYSKFDKEKETDEVKRILRRLEEYASSLQEFKREDFRSFS